MSKQTLWTEIPRSECELVESYSDDSCKLRHPYFPRPLYFMRSRAGTWYWRATDRHSDASARGYVIDEKV